VFSIPFICGWRGSDATKKAGVAADLNDDEKQEGIEKFRPRFVMPSRKTAWKPPEQPK